MKRIVFFHGLCGVSSFFDEYLNVLSDQYIVDSYDLLGHGSAQSCSPRCFRTKNAVRLNKILSKQPQLETIIIAHSISGEIANLISISPQFNLQKIVFLDSCYPSDTVVNSWKNEAQKALSSNSPKQYYVEMFSKFISKNCDKEIKQMIFDPIKEMDPIWISKVLDSTQVLDPKQRGCCDVVIIESVDSFGDNADYSWSEVYPNGKKITVELPNHFFFLESFSKTLDILKNNV